MSDAKKAIFITTTAVAVLVTAAVTTLYLKDQRAKKKIGGRLIKVNYKYSKEFDV